MNTALCKDTLVAAKLSKSPGGSEKDAFYINPRLFGAMLQLAMAEWTAQIGGWGADFSDGMVFLICGLQMISGFSSFESMHEAVRLLDELVRTCASIGLVLSPSRMKILTNEAQAPNKVFTSAGLQANALPHADLHKWLCCFLSALGSPNTTAAVEFHLNAFYANSAALCNQNASIAAKLPFFFRTFTSARPVLSVSLRVCAARTTRGPAVLQYFNAIFTPQTWALQLDTALCTARSKMDVVSGSWHGSWEAPLPTWPSGPTASRATRRQPCRASQRWLRRRLRLLFDPIRFWPHCAVGREAHTAVADARTSLATTRWHVLAQVSVPVGRRAWAGPGSQAPPCGPDCERSHERRLVKIASLRRMLLPHLRPFSKKTLLGSSSLLSTAPPCCARAPQAASGLIG